MSGVCGADRISREDVYDTANYFLKNILVNIPEFNKSGFTGSYISRLAKEEFGDIDLLVQMDCSSLKEAKRKLIYEFTENNNTLSFQYKGKIKRFYDSGEILSIKTKQRESLDEIGKTVQIDCIICLSEKEFKFKRKFLNIPAETQGLILGLVKVSRLGIENEDYEWDLSSSSLRLRDEYNKVIFKSQTWNLVEEILSEYTLTSGSTFDRIIEVIKTLDERSILRIKGLFKKMISVKSGEVGTEKGNNKLKHLKIVEDL